LVDDELIAAQVGNNVYLNFQGQSNKKKVKRRGGVQQSLRHALPERPPVVYGRKKLIINTIAEQFFYRN